ncbi:hypothetical protein Fmac_016055 [Flemingia macrophylla]|uniref:Uncharacterized protein n=1 Tax=Flemingia macrophylla TaxID=520843 RepID=A0ABD1MGA5_9FABA
MSGSIPSWIGESLQQLRVLSSRVNHLFRSVPVHLCYLRQILLLDLSRNHLSGGILTCLRNFTALMEIEVITRTGAMFRKVPSAATTGEIYDASVLLMWKGQEYVFLNPEKSFLWKIPRSLSKIDRLAVLSLSNNHLIGRIPWGRQLQTFDASSFEGNIGLCGEQLNKSCPGDKSPAKPQGPKIHGENDDSVLYEALYTS